MPEILPTTESRHPSGGIEKQYTFGNGYGASVIRTHGSYGFTRGLWELLVIESNGRDGAVHGWLSDEDVQAKLREIRDLPAAGRAS